MTHPKLRAAGLIELVQHSYNDTIHSTTGLAPNETKTVEHFQQISMRRRNARFKAIAKSHRGRQKFSPGQQVALLLPRRSIFEKTGNRTVFSQFFVIERGYWADTGYRYVLSLNNTGAPLPGTVAESSLVKILK